MEDGQLVGFRRWGYETRGWSQRTQRLYSKRIRSADAWLIEHRGVSIMDAGVRDLSDWLAQAPPTARTRNNYRSALVAFGAWLVEVGLRNNNAAEELPTYRVPRSLPRVLSSEQARCLLEVSRGAGYRDHAAVALLLYGGLRVTEARTLEWHQVEPPYVRFVGKGGVERVVPLPREALEALAHWRQRCPSPRWVFPSPTRPQPISYTTVWNRVRELGAEAGIPELHPHMLRHSYATALIERGAGVHEIAALLGHASIQTTSVYLHTRPVKLIDLVERLDYTSEDDLSSIEHHHRAS